MKLPGAKAYFLPIVKTMAGGGEFHARDMIRPVQKALDLTEEQVTFIRGNSKKPHLQEKISVALVQLVQAGLLQRTRRGYSSISQKGLEFMASNPSEINYTTLRVVGDYDPNTSKDTRRAKTGTATVARAKTLTSAPGIEAAIYDAVGRINSELVVALSKEVRRASVADLDRIVCELLEALGYGFMQNSDEAGKRILTDSLGMNHAYVKTVSDGKPDLADLQAFAGAIDTTQTDVGVYVSAQGFSSQAKGFAIGSPKQMVLLSGDELARLMVAHNIGVKEYALHVVKRIDEDFFLA